MTKINEENIRVAAYYIWEQAGCPEGADKECWIKACERLFAPKKTAKKAPAKAPAKPVVKKAPAKPAAKPVAKAPAKPAVKAAVKPAIKAAAKPAAKKPLAGNVPFYGIRKPV